MTFTNKTSDNNAFNESENNTTRIISNSFALFLRMILVTALSLYSVRFVLKGLGVVDYGVFYAIMGVVLMGTFMIPVVSSSIQRFYSYSLGKKDQKTLDSLFSVSCNIIAAISLLVFIVMEVAGTWYINNKLNIPVESASTAIWVFQSATLTFIFTIWLVPFTALIFSHEEMGIYAILSCVDCILKFAAAVMTLYIERFALLYYSLALLFISIVMLLAYFIITKRRCDECRYHIVKERKLYEEVLSFSGWTMYGALTGTAMIQGSAMLLNFFFGPLANAAFAVSNNMYNAINALANSVILSFKPAMTKVYAKGDRDELRRLFYLNNKLVLYLMAAVSIPIFVEMRTILTIWLGEYTESMVTYSRLFTIYTVLQVMHNPITTIVQSTGEIKKYFVCVETIMLLSLPLNILLFTHGLESKYLFVCIIACCVISHLTRIIILKTKFRVFSIMKYTREIVMRGGIILSLTFLVSYSIHNIVAHELVVLAMEFVCVPVVILLLTFLIGMTSVERKGLIECVHSRICTNKEI